MQSSSPCAHATRSVLPLHAPHRTARAVPERAMAGALWMGSCACGTARMLWPLLLGNTGNTGGACAVGSNAVVTRPCGLCSGCKNEHSPQRHAVRRCFASSPQRPRTRAQLPQPVERTGRAAVTAVTSAPRPWVHNDAEPQGRCCAPSLPCSLHKFNRVHAQQCCPNTPMLRADPAVVAAGRPHDAQPAAGALGCNIGVRAA